jgi:hypothetical protein
MPTKPPKPKRALPSENDKYKQQIDDIVNTLEECHDDKIKSLGTLIINIFNTTDKSHRISETVTDAIQNLTPIPGTNKELGKSNLKITNDLIKTLQQTVGNKNTPDGLIDSYKQVVKAIVEYAVKIKCPILKQTPNQLYLKNIDKLIDLDEKLKGCNESACDKIVTDNKRYENLYKTLIEENVNIIQTPISNIDRLIRFLTEYHREYKLKYKDKGYKWHQFRYAGGGLLPYLKNKREQTEQTEQRQRRKRRKRGGSKHHKTKTTKKRIKGKQTRRNKAINKTTIKVKNKTTIKVKNKTTIKVKNKPTTKAKNKTKKKVI